MDPALIALDLVKAGAIVADMIVSYLAAGAPPLYSEQPNEPNLQDCRSAPVETSVHLHPPIDAGPGPSQSGEHGSPVQPGRQSPVFGLEPAADPDPRSRSHPIWHSHHHTHGLQNPGERRGDESRSALSLLWRHRDWRGRTR